MPASARSKSRSIRTSHTIEHYQTCAALSEICLSHSPVSQWQHSKLPSNVSAYPSTNRHAALRQLGDFCRATWRRLTIRFHTLTDAML